METGITSVPENMGHPNRHVILGIILIGVAMAVVDGIVVSIALPTITGYFNVDVAQSQWVITAYLVTETSLLLIFGRISEHLGKVRLFMIGFVIFTASSLACGLANNLPLLIIFRVVQATGAAMVFSISAAIIFSIFPKGEQGRAMGYLGATIAITSIAAPMLGGFITEALGWEYIFLINVPIGIFLFLLAMKYLKIEETLQERISMDWIGAITLVGAMVTLILLLGELAQGVRASLLVLIYFLIFLAVLALFLMNERKHPFPLLDLTIFRIPAFVIPNVTMILVFIAVFMVNIIGPFYFEGVMGLTPSQVGMVFLIAPIIMVIASPITGWLYDRHESPSYAIAGVLITACALVLLAFAALQRDIIIIVLAFVPMAIGNALFQSPNNTEIMRALPPRKLGIASSVSATVRNLGMTLGVSISSILLTYQLQSAGYSGPVIGADPVLLSWSISTIMVVAAVLCFGGATVLLLRKFFVTR